MLYDVRCFLRKYPFAADFSDAALNRALSAIKQLVCDEKETEAIYEYLICIAPTIEEKDILTDIRNTKREHRRVLREIYKFFTNKDICCPGQDCCCQKFCPITYLEGIRRAILNELATIDRLQIIYEGLPSRIFRDMILRMITETQNIVAKLNYILAINAIRMPAGAVVQPYTGLSIPVDRGFRPQVADPFIGQSPYVPPNVPPTNTV